MIDVYIVYNDDNILNEIGDATLKASPFFHFIDNRTRKGKKDAFKLRSKFAAKLTPFIAVYENDKPIKAFYSETKRDIIKDLINYINDNISC